MRFGKIAAGSVIGGRRANSSFGGRRQPVGCQAVNGIMTYHGPVAMRPQDFMHSQDSENTAKYYGHVTQSHGWQYVLTVIGGEGTASVAALALVPGLLLHVESDELARFIEQRDGAIDEFMERHGVVTLEFDAWVQKKRELGLAAN